MKRDDDFTGLVNRMLFARDPEEAQRLMHEVLRAYDRLANALTAANLRRAVLVRRAQRLIDEIDNAGLGCNSNRVFEALRDLERELKK